jgi:hypothetical protein
MAEVHFQTHYIEHNARVLAGNLCGTISRLMTSNISTTKGVHSGEPSPSQQSEDSNPFSEAFIQAFVCALQLKSKLLLSRHKYKLVHFRPGDPFRPDRMVRDNDPGDQVNPRKRGKRTVRYGNSEAVAEATIKLCLFPALYLIPGETEDLEQSIESDIRQCLVDHRKFITDNMGGSGEGIVLVVKAVVLV